jgi:RNA polymerase sigma-70 factor (ECF subfamily)
VESELRRVTELLEAVRSGRPRAMDELMELVYDDLRQVAAGHLRRQESGERARVTLQPTMLVNESFLRLVDQHQGFENRAHFFAVASELILRVLLDHQRRRAAQKRGGDRARITLCFEAGGSEASEGLELVALSVALERLERLDERKARVVRLRSFGGLTAEETAREIGVSLPTVERDWAFARVWLSREIERVRPELEG